MALRSRAANFQDDDQRSWETAFEASAKNTSLYFSLVLECKDLVEGIMELSEQYYVEYTHSKSTDIL